ncbi:unnamed protein product, partial [Owenia fusiformis]
MLKEHTNTCSLKTYPCQGCNKKFNYFADYKYHRKWCEPRHCCPFCKSDLCEGKIGKDFEKCAIMHFKYTNKCPVCDKNLLGLHHKYPHVKACMRICKDKKEPDLYFSLCELCGKLFTIKKKGKYNINDRYKQHLSHVHKIGDYPCDKCDKVFFYKKELESHYRAHTGEKPHQCEVCGKRFRTRTEWTSHIAFHTNERKHVCETCGASFNSQAATQRHMVIHTGERKHKCDVCLKCFTQQSALKRHKQSIHDKIRAFKCDTCDVSYTQRYALTLHLKEKHGIEPATKANNRDNYNRRLGVGKRSSPAQFVRRSQKGRKRKVDSESDTSTDSEADFTSANRKLDQRGTDVSEKKTPTLRRRNSGSSVSTIPIDDKVTAKRKKSYNTSEDNS